MDTARTASFPPAFLSAASAGTAPLLTPALLAQRLGRPDAPWVLDVRRGPAFAASDRLLPAARRCAPEAVAAFAHSHAPREVVVYCVHGHGVSAEAAAVLRAAGWDARWLEGGIEGGELGVDAAEAIERWRAQGLPVLRKRADLGVTGERPSRWITRARPKVDRVACPWLIRRFIDPRAQFHYVAQAQVAEQALALGAVPFDVHGSAISHEWERCSFDALLAAFGLRLPALDALAAIVRGADTDRPSLAPQAAGLLALSLGLSRLHREDDPAMLEAAMPLYDALYAWCADAREESHQWQGHEPAQAPA